MMIAILCGSSRKDSNTSKVGKAIARIAQTHGVPSTEIFMPDFHEYDLPFNQHGGLKMLHLTDFQAEIKNAMAAANMIFVLSPEYNWFPSAEIINLINHFGSKDFAECWQNKVFATCGVSNGRGGRIPAVQLSYVINKLINVMDFESIVSPKMFESQFTPKVLDPEGLSLGNEEYDKGLDKFVAYNLNLAAKISKTF